MVVSRRPDPQVPAARRSKVRILAVSARWKPITTGALLLSCAAALTITFLGKAGAGSRDILENRATRFVKAQYGLLASGKYDALSQRVVEGRWKRGAAGWQLEGILPPSGQARQLEDDLGVGAWRLHFVSLNAVKFQVVRREEFRGVMRRESEILDSIDPSERVQSISIVSMKGHNTGRCSIVEWERQVPVVEKDGSWLILMRGTPEVYSLVHNEQWFEPVRF